MTVAVVVASNRPDSLAKFTDEWAHLFALHDIEFIPVRDEPATWESMPLPFTQRSKNVLELALKESLDRGSEEIGAEHLLLALIRESEGIACQVVRSLGVTLVDLHNKTVELMETT